MALLFGLVGFFSNPFLLFIALFVWIGAAQEAGMVQIKSAVEGILVSRVMLTDFRALSPGDSLHDAIQLIVTGSQRDFPVVEDGRLLGILTRDDLLLGLSRSGPEAPVSGVMHREFASADSSETLETVYPRLQTLGSHTLPVVHNGQLVGLLTRENFSEFLMIQAALDGAKRSHWPDGQRPIGAGIEHGARSTY